MDTEDYHSSVPVTARVPRNGIMHLLLGNQHARLNLRMHAVAVLTRGMRGNKIDFLPVEDELRERRRLKRQINKTLEHQKSLWKAT